MYVKPGCSSVRPPFEAPGQKPRETPCRNATRPQNAAWKTSSMAPRNIIVDVPGQSFRSAGRTSRGSHLECADGTASPSGSNRPRKCLSGCCVDRSDTLAAILASLSAFRPLRQKTLASPRPPPLAVNDFARARAVDSFVLEHTATIYRPSPPDAVNHGSSSLIPLRNPRVGPWCERRAGPAVL